MTEIKQEDNRKEFFGMKYPFIQCARPVLLKEKLCRDCSVERFCDAPEKLRDDEEVKH